MDGSTITGAEILLQSLLNHHVNTIFGYPGSCVMSVLDCLYNKKDSINHILVRHEQGAIHAAQGYAQVSGKTGVALLTSGPGATNTVTGIADAMINSMPLVVITGQVHSKLLGTDAFQEIDIIGITHSITKWTYQVSSAEEIAPAIAHAFHIASTGRPGPVLLDITKDAQTEEATYIPQKIDFIRSYDPMQEEEPEEIAPLSSCDKVKDTIADQIIEILRSIEQDLILVLDTEVNYEPKPNQSSTFYKIIQSEKFGVMGFGLPAAIGAKYAAPHKTVCLITHSDQFQTTIQELGVIMQSGIDIKIFLLNNRSKTKAEIRNPDFRLVMNAYNIPNRAVWEVNNLKTEVLQVVKHKGSYFIEINP